MGAEYRLSLIFSRSKHEKGVSEHLFAVVRHHSLNTNGGFQHVGQSTYHSLGLIHSQPYDATYSKFFLLSTAYAPNDFYYMI